MWCHIFFGRAYPPFFYCFSVSVVFQRCPMWHALPLLHFEILGKDHHRAFPWFCSPPFFCLARCFFFFVPCLLFFVLFFRVHISPTNPSSPVRRHHSEIPLFSPLGRCRRKLRTPILLGEASLAITPPPFPYLFRPDHNARSFLSPTCFFPLLLHNGRLLRANPSPLLTLPFSFSPLLFLRGGGSMFVRCSRVVIYLVLF